MGGQRTSFSKLQRDRDKKAKAAAKRERRQERSATSEEDLGGVLVDDGHSELSADDLLKLIESIHQRFEAGTMTYEEFEEQKVDLLSRLPVD